jgi:signal transduction histidine kinase
VVTLRPPWALALLLAAGPARAAPHVALPDRLPWLITEGWEASDDDPAAGVRALAEMSWHDSRPLTEPGAPGKVRWYRVRLDLSRLRGEPLAFVAGAIRDVDEAYLDGVRIGGLGAFPPHLRSASTQPRIYPLPTDVVNQPGTRTLALRIHHNPSPSAVFRFSPLLDRLAVTRARSYYDQVLVASAAFYWSLAVALFVLDRRSRPGGAARTFAVAAVLASLYLLSGHTAWSQASVPPSLPFRLTATTGGLLCAFYGMACWQVLGRRAPWRFRAYFAVFALYAAAAAAVPDPAVMVVPTRIVRVLALFGLADLCLPTLMAVRAGNRSAVGLLGSHVLFALGIVYLNLRPTAATFSTAPALAGVVLAGGLYTVGLRQIRARYAAIQRERTRISRDIHDTLSQSLVATSLRLDAALEALPDSAEAARDHLARARAQVQASMEESRRAVWRIRPEAQSGRDLAAALASLGEELASGTDLRVRVDTWGEPRPLPSTVESNLFRIGQEAITNVVRHARAREVRVELRFEPGAVRLQVRDDGSGLSGARSLRRVDGPLGLRGMRERAEELGGRLEVSSIQGRGTEIAVTVPTTGR